MLVLTNTEYNDTKLDTSFIIIWYLYYRPRQTRFSFTNPLFLTLEFVRIEQKLPPKLRIFLVGTLQKDRIVGITNGWFIKRNKTVDYVIITKESKFESNKVADIEAEDKDLTSSWS